MNDSGVATWEQRWHPLREEWVIVAAHRQRSSVARRTGDGIARRRPPAYVEDCYFCPGNRARERRAQPAVPSRVRVRQRSSVCRPRRAAARSPPPPGIYRNAPATGIARVVCYTPRHNIDARRTGPATSRPRCCARGASSTVELGARPEVRHVLIFENKGEVVGVSNPHPHGQIYATNFVFKTIETEAREPRAISPSTAACCSRTSSRSELDDGRRMLFENASAIVVPAVLRALRLRVLCRAEGHARQPGDDDAGRAGRPGGGAQMAARPLRQPLADVVSLRADAAPGADRRRRLPRVPLSHRVSPAAAQAAPAEVPRRAGDRRRQLPQRHAAGGRRRRNCGRFPPSTTAPAPMPDPRTLLAPILEWHARVRDAVVAATERQAVDALAAVDRDDEGDTIYAIDVIGEAVIERFAEALRREQSFVLVAEGLPGGQRCVPETRRTRRHLADHRRPDRRHARPDVPEAQRLDPHRRGAESRPGDLAARHRPGGADGDSARQAAPCRSALGGTGRRRRGGAAEPVDRRAACRCGCVRRARRRIAHGFSTVVPLLSRRARRAGRARRRNRARRARSTQPAARRSASKISTRRPAVSCTS